MKLTIKDLEFLNQTLKNHVNNLFLIKEECINQINNKSNDDIQEKYAHETIEMCNKDSGKLYILIEKFTNEIKQFKES